MNDPPSSQAENDSSQSLVDLYGQVAKTWSGVMSNTVANRSVAELLGLQIQLGFGSLAWMRRQASGLVSFSLRQLNVPARSDVLALSERLTHLEMAIDDLDAKLDLVGDQMEVARPASETPQSSAVESAQDV